MSAEKSVLLSDEKIGGDHLRAQLASGDLGTHPSFSRALVGSPSKRVHFSRPEVPRINPNDDVSRLNGRAGLVCDRVDYANLFQSFALKAQGDSQFGCTPLHELANRMLTSGGNDEIFRLILLENQPLQRT